MAKNLIVVLDDGETWGGVDGCNVMLLTDRAYEQLMNGMTPKDLDDDEVISCKFLEDLLENGEGI